MSSDLEGYLIEIQSEAEFLQEKLAKDEAIDLDKFEEKITEFCQIIVSLPQEEAKQYVDQMDIVIGLVQELSEGLHKQRDSLTTELNDLQDHSNAALNYEQHNKSK